MINATTLKKTSEYFDYYTFSLGGGKKKKKRIPKKS